MPAPHRRAEPPAEVAIADPPFGAAWAALAYTAAVLALMYPALSGHLLVNPMSDQLSGFSYRVFGANYFHATHSIPLWNPYLLGGLPFVAAQHGDIFYPTFLLRMVLPPDAVMNLSFGLHLVLAGLFTYGFLRAWRFGTWSAMLGGLAYLLSGQVSSLASPGHDGKLYVSTLMPLILWMILLGMRDGRLWAWGVMALATGLAVLSPHFQMVYYTGILAIAFTLYLAFRGGDERLPARARWTRLGYATLAAALGFAIASVHFLPFFEYIPFSPRAGGRGYEYATGWSMPPEEIFNAYLPQFSGILDLYWGRNAFKLDSEYIGATVLPLVGAAFGSKPRRSYVWFWTATGIVSLFAAFGGHTPFYRLVYALPMMHVARAPSMIYFMPTFALAMLAAAGCERALRGEVGARYWLGWVIGAVLIALLATSGVLAQLAQGLAIPERYEAVQADAPSMLAGAWRSTAFVALSAALFWAFRRGRLPAPVAATSLLALVAVDLWTVDRNYFLFSPPARVIYGSNAAIDYLRTLPEPGRTIALPVKELQPGRDPFLEGDALMMYNVRTLTGHQANELQRWVQLAGAKSPAPPQNLGSRQFRRLTNAKFWLTNGDLGAAPVIPELRFIKRAGPVSDAAGNPLYVFELDEDNPAAWVTPVMTAAPPDAVFATVLDPRFDAARAALFDTSAHVPAVDIQALPEPLEIRARVTRYDPGRITVQLDRPAPVGSALVVSENWYPGWTATVDGKAAPSGQVDYSLIGVPLPAGARSVDLAFDERVYHRGKVLTLLALGLTVLAIAGGTVLERRGA